MPGNTLGLFNSFSECDHSNSRDLSFFSFRSSA